MQCTVRVKKRLNCLLSVLWGLLMTVPDSPTLLIIDDSVENLQILCGLLRPEYRVLAARSGESGLQVAAGTVKPELILLDVMCPEWTAIRFWNICGTSPRLAISL